MNDREMLVRDFADGFEAIVTAKVDGRPLDVA